MLVAYILVGAILEVGSDGAVIKPEVKGGIEPMTKEKCEDVKKGFEAEFDALVKEGRLKGYVVKCQRVELEVPKDVSKK